jgi:hypothetical protein
MVQVFSFCIYGPYRKRYHDGLLENIKIIEQYFPDWKVYVYYGADTTREFLQTLSTHSCVVLRPTNETGAINMVHRFYAIDEDDVEIMFSRDADSRIHWKDRWAIREFVNAPEVLHSIRDNVEHNTLLCGGLWGIKKTANINIHQKYEEFKEQPIELGFGNDQNFLRDKIYPPLADKTLAHYSFDNCKYQMEHAVKFPFEWKNDTYCGRVEGDDTAIEIRHIPKEPKDNVQITNILRRK